MEYNKFSYLSTKNNINLFWKVKIYNNSSIFNLEKLIDNKIRRFRLKTHVNIVYQIITVS